mmetsp:Transcript_9571/g.26447  ORF Transcript_9571/g.26447 Transcript_9571/m.26447 type:complete len:264 (+) Transcript_9571:1208-1999(+)
MDDGTLAIIVWILNGDDISRKDLLPFLVAVVRFLLLLLFIPLTFVLLQLVQNAAGGPAVSNVFAIVVAIIGIRSLFQFSFVSNVIKLGNVASLLLLGFIVGIVEKYHVSLLVKGLPRSQVRIILGLDIEFVIGLVRIHIGRVCAVVVITALSNGHHLAVIAQGLLQNGTLPGARFFVFCHVQDNHILHRHVLTRGGILAVFPDKSRQSILVKQRTVGVAHGRLVGLQGQGAMGKGQFGGGQRRVGSNRRTGPDGLVVAGFSRG